MIKSLYIGLILLAYTIVKLIMVRTQIKKTHSFASARFEKLSSKDREVLAGMIYSFYINFSAVVSVLIIITSFIFNFNEKMIFGMAIAVFVLDLLFKNFVVTNYYERKVLSIGKKKVQTVKALKKDGNIEEVLIIKNENNNLDFISNEVEITNSKIIEKWFNQLMLLNLIVELNIDLNTVSDLYEKTYNEVLIENDTDEVKAIFSKLSKQLVEKKLPNLFEGRLQDNLVTSLQIVKKITTGMNVYDERYVIKKENPKYFNSCGFTLFSNLGKDTIIPYPMKSYCAYIDSNDTESFVIISSIDGTKQYINYYTGNIECCDTLIGNYSNLNQYIEWLIRYSL